MDYRENKIEEMIDYIIETFDHETRDYYVKQLLKQVSERFLPQETSEVISAVLRMNEQAMKYGLIES